jgi:hypothetical protein
MVAFVHSSILSPPPPPSPSPSPYPSPSCICRIGGLGWRFCQQQTYTDPVSVKVLSFAEVNAQAGTALPTEHLVFLLSVEAISLHLRLAVTVKLDVLAFGVYFWGGVRVELLASPPIRTSLCLYIYILPAFCGTGVEAIAASSGWAFGLTHEQVAEPAAGGAVALERLIFGEWRRERDAERNVATMTRSGLVALVQLLILECCIPEHLKHERRGTRRPGVSLP